MALDSSSLWWSFFLLGLATLLPRSSFIVLGEKVSLPSSIKHALRYAPAASLAAIISPDIFLIHGHFQIGNPKIISAICTAAIALRLRNPWLPFLIGMGVLQTLSHL